jgi:prevent-host-death family protein
MSEGMSEGRVAARVGIRELRQNLSVYVDRVKEGEELEVTEHGRTVARLVPPVRQELSVIDRLIAEGKARPERGDLMEVLPPPPIDLPPGVSVSEILRQQREDERW